MFEPLVASNTAVGLQNMENFEQQLLYLNREVRNVCTVNATAEQTSEGIVVLKESFISPKEDENIPTAVKNMRKKARLDENGCTKDNYLFNSPSYTAVFVLGKSANGLTEWKNSEGITLKVLENQV